MIYSTELVIVATSVLALGVAGFVVHRMIRHVDKRINLMLRASYHNSRDIKENLETVDVTRTETRKALEHQRVLLSSLNQQIRNLESAIANESIGKRPDFKNAARRFETKPEVMFEEPVVRKKIKKRAANKKQMAKKIKKEGLLGNLDEFLERGIEQIVANDVLPGSYAEPAVDVVEEIPMAVQELIRQEPVIQESVSVVEQEVVNTVAEVRKEVKKNPTNTRRGGVISMEKLLQQQKQQRAVQGEKTEKIVKLSSIFAHRGRVAQASNGIEREKNVSLG